jgi:tetratricopeptide (TPR) repeat protein/pimeloyl-ACP methyl ester carboxylesterase
VSRLIKISDWNGDKRSNVVFVHGLGGHPYDTWRRSPSDDTFWPLWLAEDIKGLAVYSLGYVSPPTNWIGTAMPLLDEAAHALRVLLNSADLKTGDISFVCHSLGGLIVKQMLRAANEQQHNNPELASFLERTGQVVFIATPHTGSGKATLIERLGFLAWGTDSARDLVANKPELRDLNFGYRELATSRGDALRHLVYYEMVDTLLGRIVNPDSADPGLPHCKPTPIRENHITIAKPRRRDELVYSETRSFISKLAFEPAAVAEIRRYPLEPFEIVWSWHQIVPKLLRVAAIALLALGLWRGVPRLNAAIDTIFMTHQHVVDSANFTSEQLEKLSRQLADMQARLAPQPVTPEAKDRAAKRIEPAIQDLLLRTDERSKRAFEALRNGDTSAAENLFGSILEEKSREGEEKSREAQSANREAATAARNIAAFTRLTNVAKAAELYARAAALDPDDFQTWIDLGDMSVASGQVARVGTAFARAFAIANRLAKSDPGNAGWQRDLSVSYNKIGDVQVDQGNLSEALKSYRDGLEIRDRLAKSDPGNAGWQRNLSVSYNKIGDVQVAQGNLPEALKSYRDGMAIADRLAKSDPGNAGWQRDLSVSYNNIGGVQVDQGNLSEALKSYRAELAIADRLAKSDPGNAGWQRDLSVSYNKIGDVQVTQGNLPEALKSYRDGLEIRDRLAKSDPGNAGWQRDLSVSYDNIGGVQVDQGNLSEALKSYRDGHDIFDRLAKSDPGNAGWQRDLSVSYNKIGDVQVTQGNLPEALKSYRDGLEIRDRLAKSDPGNAGWQRDLSVSFSKLANVFRKGGDKTKAIEALQQGRAIIVRMTSLSPDNAVWKRDLAWFDGQIAELGGR